MDEKVLIFGKDTWPFTNAAREAFAKGVKKIEYFNVVSNKENLDKMLSYTDGKRKVPVCVDGEKVIIGFNGKAWRV